MKKHIFFLTALIAICLSFVSCEKEGISASSLVGTWFCVEQTVSLDNGQTYTYSKKEDWLDDDNYLVLNYGLLFTADGYYNSIDSYLDSFDDFRTPYKVDGKILYVYGIAGGEIISNRGGTLVIELRPGHSGLDLTNIALEAMGYDAQIVKAVCTYKKQ